MIAGNPFIARKPQPSLGLAVIAGLLLGLCPAGSAQTNLPPGRVSQSRYLLVVETSRAIQKRSDNVIKATTELIRSGVNGQMRDGDTIGLWTYNDSFYAGKFPLALWSSKDAANIAASAKAFLKRQKFENKVDFQPVTFALNKVAQNSRYLTIIVVSSGEDDIDGLPFASNINEAYATWRKAQEKSKMPFFTTIRAQQGRFSGYVVTPAPFQIELPEWRTEPTAKSVAATAATTNSPVVSTSTVPNLIVRGKKPAPMPAVTDTNLGTSIPAPGPGTGPGSPDSTTPTTAQTPTSDSAAASDQGSTVTSSSSTLVTPTGLAVETPKAVLVQPAASRPVQSFTPSPAQTAAAFPRTSIFSSKLAWGGSIALVLCLALIAFWRRSHGAGSESLISRSLRQQSK